MKNVKEGNDRETHNGRKELRGGKDVGGVLVSRKGGREGWEVGRGRDKGVEECEKIKGVGGTRGVPDESFRRLDQEQPGRGTRMIKKCSGPDIIQIRRSGVVAPRKITKRHGGQSFEK